MTQRFRPGQGQASPAAAADARPRAGDWRAQMKAQMAGMTYAEQQAFVRPPDPRPVSATDSPDSLRYESGSAPATSTDSEPVQRSSDPVGDDANEAALDAPSTDGEARPTSADTESTAPSKTEDQQGNEAIIESLTEALARLDSIDAAYTREVPGLIGESRDYAERLIEACTEAVRGAQEFVNGEHDLRLQIFQASHLAVLAHATASTLIGLVPGPYGPILGFVYSAGQGLWEADRTNQQVAQGTADNTFLGQALAETSDAVIQHFMRQQGSHVHEIGVLQGRLIQIRDGVSLQNTRRRLHQELNFARESTELSSGHMTLLEDLSSDANVDVDEFAGLVGDLRLAVSQMGDSASRASAEGQAALARLLDLYVTYLRANRRLEISGRARRRSPRASAGFSMAFTEFNLGERESVSPQVREHLLGRNVQELARAGIPVSAWLRLVRSRGPDGEIALHQTVHGRSPTRPPESARRSLSELGNYRQFPTEDERTQAVLDELWERLSTNPLRRAFRSGG